MEDRVWFEDSEAVVFTAEYLVASGRPALDVLNCFQRPWEFDQDYEDALQWKIDSLCGDFS